MKFRKDLPEGGSANYLKLKDGESAEGIFRGDLKEFYSRFVAGKSEVVTEETPGARFRAKINFVVKDGPTYVPKIWELSQTTYQVLGELHNEYDLEKTVIRLTRKGTGLDTTYTMMPLVKTPIPEATLNLLANLELHSLEADVDIADTPITDGSPLPDEEIPF